MNESQFVAKIKKQLWFLNNNEQIQLERYLNHLIDNNDEKILQRPIYYANQFLKNYVFKEKNQAHSSLVLLLFLIIVLYVVFMGLFLFGFITSLTAVNYFINPQVKVATWSVILILIGAILLIIISLWLIKKITAYATKKLLEYKFNQSRS